MTKQKLYKVLVNGRSCHGGNLKYSLPKKVKGKWIPGKWMVYKGEISICKAGLHITKEPSVWFKLGCTCYEVEVGNINEWGHNKGVTDKIRLLKEVPYEKWLGVKTSRILKKINTRPDYKKYNPYKATKLPSLKRLRSKISDQVGDQVWDQVRAQVWAQVRDQVRDQVWDQVRDQVRAQVWDQVRAQVMDQVEDQVWATSYWAIKLFLNLPINHWFGNFLQLGVLVVFVNGKAKVFGRKGKFLGEYDQEDLSKKTEIKI